jgi:hypothetical protein
MESARRFRALLSELGLKRPEAAKKLHLSLRTLHNWCNGTHDVPYSALKCLRLMRYTELPGEAWAGWHFTRGNLVTPEGRIIAAHEGSWWSLLVARARAFDGLSQRLKQYQNAAAAADVGEARRPLTAVAGVPNLIVPPVGNTGGTNGLPQCEIGGCDE